MSIAVLTTLAVWEDSLEMMAPLWWTPDFLEVFEKNRGYSATKYLPVFF